MGALAFVLLVAVVLAIGYVRARFRRRRIVDALGPHHELVLGRDGHLDSETQARLRMAGLDPAKLERQLARQSHGKHVVTTVVNVRLEDAPKDPEARARIREALDEQLDKLGIEHAAVDARIEQGEDDIRVEQDGPRLRDLAKLRSAKVKTFVHLDVERGATTPEARAKLDEQLDELGIDRSEIDARLDAGETHIDLESDKPPAT